MSPKCKRFEELEPGQPICPHCKLWSVRLGKCKEHDTIIESNKPLHLPVDEADLVGWARW
jgi:hypothetical protein